MADTKQTTEDTKAADELDKTQAAEADSEVVSSETAESVDEADGAEAHDESVDSETADSVDGDGDDEATDETDGAEAADTADDSATDDKPDQDADAPSEKKQAEAAKTPADEAKSSDEPGQWYVVHTQSGFEAKAKEALEQRIKSLGFTNRIFEIIVPMRDIVTINKGKKRQKKEKVFPGYILVRMILDNDSWIVVRTTQGITGFVGAGTKPTAISDKEVQAIMKFVRQEQPKFKAKFSVGEAVKVTDGPFADMVGTISQIDEDKGKVTVLVLIFGRETPVELDFLQVNKLNQ